MTPWRLDGFWKINLWQLDIFLIPPPPSLPGNLLDIGISIPGI